MYAVWIFDYLFIQRLNLYKSLSLYSFGLPNVSLSEPNHLRHCLGRKNGQEICNKNEPVLFAVSGAPSGLDSAQSDALALIRAAPSPVDERGVEAMHIEVLIVDEEALADSRVTVLVRLNVKFDLVVLELALIRCQHGSLVREYRWTVPVLFGLQFLD